MNSNRLHLKVIDIYWKGSGRFHAAPWRWRGFFKTFLDHFRGLKELALEGVIVLPLPSIADCVSSHGETLEVLKLFYVSVVRRLPFQSYQRHRTTAGAIKAISDTCPRLQKLTLMLHFGDVSKPGNKDPHPISSLTMIRTQNFNEVSSISKPWKFSRSTAHSAAGTKTCLNLV